MKRRRKGEKVRGGRIGKDVRGAGGGEVLSKCWTRSHPQ